jgi:hypothetical protein
MLGTHDAELSMSMSMRREGKGTVGREALFRSRAVEALDEGAGHSPDSAGYDG